MTKRTAAIGTRLHFGLIDLGEATDRRFGGVGVALDEPRSVISWCPAPGGSMRILNEAGVDDRGIDVLAGAIQRLQEESRRLAGTMTIERIPPQHVGLGVTTSLVLGSLDLLNRTAALGFSRTRLIQLSGRGGTSGVGVTAFFDGGVVVDAGQARRGDAPLLPSGAGRAANASLHVVSLPFPKKWAIRLLLPDGLRWSGSEEIEFFRTHTPIPDAEVFRTLALTYHGLIPSILEEDLGALKTALDSLNRTGFKAREIASHGKTVRELLDKLQDTTEAAAGMSSMGRLVYAIGPEEVVQGDEVTKLIDERMLDLGMSMGRALSPTAGAFER